MVHLVKKDGKVVGWQMRPTTPEEQTIAAWIRDLQFFGIGDTVIKYKGLKLIDDAVGKQEGNIESLTWMQDKYEL